jgi:hypothetical protein
MDIGADSAEVLMGPELGLELTLQIEGVEFYVYRVAI